MPGLPLHRLLTEAALKALPPNRYRLWKEVQDGLLREYCMFPDHWYAAPDRIGPYLCFTDAIPFHYPPSESVIYNNWEVIPTKDGGRASLKSTGYPLNQHHRHCRRAFEFYFKAIPEALRSGRMHDAAKYLGAISHAIQDNATPTHCLEGMDGTDVMLFDRYIEPPKDKPVMTPSRIFRQILKPLDLGELATRDEAIGNSAAEAGFLFYTEFGRVVSKNRLCLLPMLQAAYNEDEATWKDILRSVLRRTAELNAAFLNTCHVLAEAPADNVTPPQSRVYLSDLRPSLYSRYLSPPYSESAMVRNRALSRDLSFIPLELEFKGGHIETFERGLGMGAHAEFLIEHELPPEVYRNLQGAIGLHARLGRDGKVALRWELDDKVLWEDCFDKAHLAARFQIPVNAGGVLRLRGFSRTGKALDPANQIVLGEPVLA